MRYAMPENAASQRSATKVFPAPTRGWIRNDSLATAKGGGAEALDNWFPTPEGCRLRKGSQKRATIGGAVTHMAVYDTTAGGKHFATDATSIYDVTNPASATVPVVASVTGLTGGDFSSVQFSTAAGQFLMMVNGTDDLRRFDGTSWLAINAASTPAITGVATSELSHIWKFANRLWFIEEGTMDAWYLDALAVAGAATVFPLGGVFNLGGSLMFGATWSLDAGDGLDDVCLFFTDKGEVAVYQGDDPATNMTLVGVYRIGVPLHKNATFRAGGDLAVVTDDGIFPISAAVKQDRAGLKGSAITYPIEEAWRFITKQRSNTDFPFSVAMWHSETMLVVGIPTFGALPAVSYVANARTGAWCRYTGWDIRCLSIFNDELYFGTSDGTIVQGEVLGNDQGENYTGLYVPRFDTLGSPAEKAAIHARVIARANNPFTPQLFANSEYIVDPPIPFNADTDDNSNAWDAGIWNVSTWGASTDVKTAITNWQSVAAVGHALAPGIQITTGRTTAPDIELIALHLQYEIGEVMG